MVIKIGIVLIFLLVVLLGLSLVNGVGLQCAVATDCIAPKIPVLKISNPAGGHAEILSNNEYAHKVCCEGSGFVLGNSCGTANSLTILKISSATNAHVQIPSFTTYGNDMCLSTSGSLSISCDYKPACSSDETCLASISANNNAQIADCITDHYPQKICCKCDSGTVSGNVKNTDNENIEGARIDLIQDFIIKYTAFTNTLGDYQIDGVSCGTYDIIVSADSYVSSAKVDLFLPTADPDTSNFILVPGTTCEADCTYAGDNIVHKECNNINGCTFYDATAMEVCNFAQPGWIRDYNNIDPVNCPDGDCAIECAEGIPERKVGVKASITCKKENIIKLTKIINYKGKLTKLIVITCG
tara:strand:- start:314 stop:1381 length:1068 start_codon:yes stop_codon:yes gene_type:complete